MTDGTASGAGSPHQARPSRRTITLAILRALGCTVVLVVIYYLMPLDHASVAAVITILIIGLVALIALIILQVRAILRSRFPGVRAVEALGTSVPLFLLLFAGVYLAMSSISSGSFGQRLSHTDALYFALTVFSTVGFGDITAKTEAARLVVTGQMAADLIIIGLGAKAILGAVARGREQRA